MSEKVKKLVAMLLVFIIASNSVVCFTNGAEISSEKDATKEIEEVEKESIKEIYSALKENDEVTVSIWLRVNENKEVEKKVKEKTGFDFNNLSVLDEEISTDFVEGVVEYSKSLNEEDGKEFVKDMKDYYKATEKKRKKEKENTDTFLSEYRIEMKEEVNNQVEKFKLDYFSDDTAKIKFTDELAPIIIVDIDKNKMQTIENDTRVSSIELVNSGFNNAKVVKNESTSYDKNKSFVDGLEECKNYAGINKVHEKLSYRGTDINVGVLEASVLVANDEILSSRLKTKSLYDSTDASDKEHVEQVSCIIAGGSGIAPDTMVYSAGLGEEGISLDMLSDVYAWFIANKVNIVNQSFAFEWEEDVDPGHYNDYERYYDFIINSYRITVVQAAGNDYSERVCVPGLASNIITVGAYDHVATASKTDDIRCDFSSYYNYGTEGIAKPDFIAQGVFGNTQGTSFSAPYVTGIIALMADIRPSILANPHLIKAILMASCQYKAQPALSSQASGVYESTETMDQGLTERQGAGVVDPYLALCITAQKNYYTGTVQAGEEFLYYLRKPSYGSSKINFSLAWLNFSLDGRPASMVEGWQQDLDLRIYKNSTSNLLKSSSKSKSSTEMVYLTNMTSINDYIIKILNNADEDFSEFAVAWCSSGEHFNYRNDTQGVFSIKNKKEDGFLTTNSTKYTYLYESPFQQGSFWIMRPAQTNYCSLQSTLTGKSNNKFLGKATTTLYGEYMAVSDDISDTSLYVEYALQEYEPLEPCENGSIRLKYSNDYLGLSDRNYSSYGKYANWNSQYIDPEVTYWYLNRADYKEGDANLDYILDASDANLILSIASKTEEPDNNLVEYLCDTNGDAIINSADALLVLKFASDLL